MLEKLSRSREWERRRERVRFELHRIYPPPARFGAEDVFKHFPELRTVQNAFAYLRTSRSSHKFFPLAMGYSVSRRTESL